VVEKIINPPLNEPIAIIGMSCRFPKAENINEFLSILERGANCISDIPLERWDNDQYYDADEDAPGKLYIKQLGFIDNIKNFDADFFNISPREAKFMSPHLRIFIETSYHALEDANLSLDALKGSYTGVFVGCGKSEYPQLLAKQGLTLEDESIYSATGNVSNALAGRVAYTFDFHGPTQAVDTACSSSMTAIHNACLSLQAGECTMALAGGVNLVLLPYSNITLSKAKMLSPASRCKTFSEDADGYARSEGCGVLVLKPLRAAIKDKDTILAVIKGSAINSDGKSAGFTVPNGSAQEELIRSAMARANLSPADIDCIEAHGTGTPLADPIEVNTLTKIFSDYHDQEKPLYLGSVKTNIGHCESASGVAGIIKAVLSLQNNKLFQHLNFKKLNPEIHLKNTIIPLSSMNWHKERGLRNIGVSSFGFTGSNAHVIVQEAVLEKKEQLTCSQESLLVLSAKSKTALELLIASYQKYLANTQDEFANICYTAATCRTHFLFRTTIKANTAKQAATCIEKQAYAIYQIKKEKDTDQQPTTIEHLQTAYQNGLKVNWSAFYDSLTYPFVTVKLPLYEFAREEYWFGDKNRLQDAQLPKNWCFQLQWQHQPCTPNNPQFQGNPWLLIGASPLASAFKMHGLNIVLEEDNYPLEKLDGVIFAAALDATPTTDIDCQKNTIKKLLHLLKQLNHQAIELQLIVLTSQAIAELADGKLNLNNSPLIGFCRTLVLELPQYKTILIDLEHVDNSNNVLQVLNELHYNQEPNYEHVIAYRDNKRLAARLQKTTLIPQKRSIQGKGRYLITGGTGGLGLVTAQALLSAGAKELILTARNVSRPEVKKAIKKIQYSYPERTIRTLGLDVANKEKLATLLLDINADGLLKGIIHAAGTSINAPLLELQDEDVDALFSGKVQGAWYLHELSQQCELDFFVVYSSISSVFGSNKESVYSAANSFLNALIAERQLLGLTGTSIQWGPWGEVGMASKRSRDPSLKQALISNEQGQTLIKTLLNGQLNEATIISPEYLRFMLDFVPKPLPAFYQALADDLKEEKRTVNKSSSSWLNEYLGLSDDKRFQACQDMLSGICKEIMELPETEELDEDEGFFEIGFDSLMIAEMAGRLKKKLEPTLSVMINIGFDYPSINKLAKFIEYELSDNLLSKKITGLSPKPTDDAIAIIGMSCSLPNAPDISAFETLLEAGLSGIKPIPVERWDNKLYYDPNVEAPGKSCVHQLGLIDHIKSFDAHFFGISPREAKLMEPQQRIFLEYCYKALEHANYSSESLRGSLTGVFAGVGPNEYSSLFSESNYSNDDLGAYSITGNVLNMIPGRVSYTFDFKGPSIGFFTDCSSSLVAIHYACQSLKNGESDFALAGGINILLNPESNIQLCKAKALSPEGLCKTFDEQANGYARAEGCGVVVLKRLSDARRDKDTILAVIKASAVNHDGKSAGLTVPNGTSQEEVMRKALSLSELSSHDISYIETHGTGTPLGDPIEVHAINKVYGGQRSKDNPLYLGAVKTNIGHLESASGIASLIKTVISLQKKKIYKNLNFNKLNPNIILNDTRIALQNMDWNTDAQRKCAGVSAFGFSGTNAHVILQEFPLVTKQELIKSAKTLALVLSAKSKTALANLAKSYQHYLASTKHDWRNICFTAATCRDHYTYRLAVIANNTAEASLLLEKHQFSLSFEEHHSVDLAHDSLLKEYLQGKKVNWAAYYQTCDDDFIKVALPNYTFDISEFWPKKISKPVVFKKEMHPLLGQMFSMPGNEYLFCHQLDLDRLSFIRQHILFEKIIFPATAFIESGLAAAKAVLQCSVFCMEQFTIERLLHPKQGQDFQVQVKPKYDERYTISIYAKQHDTWQLYCTMELLSLPPAATESVAINALKSSFGDPVDVTTIYERFKNRSLFYGDEFQVIQEGYVSANSVLARVALTKTNQDMNYYYHPVLLDGAMQSMLLLSSNNYDSSIYVPYAFTRITTFQETPRSIWVHLTQHAAVHEKELCVDIKLYDNSGLLIGFIEGLKLRIVTRSNFISYEYPLEHLYHTQWILLHAKVQTKAELPEFLVISKDKIKAQKLFGRLNYQLVHDFSKLVEMEHKNIVFLYEQDQFNDLVHCCQKMFQVRPHSFILVTENAYAVNEGDKVNPYHTMASSFWKSFSNELELYRIDAIDSDNMSHLEEVLNYLFNNTTHENQFAIRDSIYIPRLQKKKLPIMPAQQDILFTPDASYLIIGGTGGLAHVLIEYLIRKNVKHIILVSKSKYPKDIETLIESNKQKQIYIQHVAADASNYQQMEHLFAQIKQDFKPLKGVFHLAGVVQDGLLVNLRDDAIQSVLRAKMASALVLHQLTQQMHLDFFVLFSSSASLLGAKGQANYAAANGFLDGLAYLRQQQGLPALAINWGPFHAVGMTKNLTQALQQHGFIPLDKESIEVLDVLLQSQLTQIAVCPTHWNIYFKHSPKPMWLDSLFKKTLPSDKHFLNSLRQRTKEERISMLSHALCEITADVLSLDDLEKITAEDGLFSMGLDSLMSIEIRNKIHDKLRCPNLNLSIEYFVNQPRINKIARYIADELEHYIDKTSTTLPSEYPIQEEIALCDFQYRFWVINKLGFSFNIGLRVQLLGKLNRDYLFQAFDFVVQQNSVFWTCFSEDAPIQSLNKQGQLELIYNDISLSEEPNLLQNEFNKNSMVFIQLTKQPLIRIFLYKIDRSLHELHVIIPHIIVDDTSCDLVLSQFKKCYETLSLGRKLLQEPEENSYFSYVKHNNSHYEKNLKSKIAFWQAYNKDFKLLHFNPAYQSPDTGKHTKHLYHYPVATQLMEQFIDWHKAKNSNFSTGLIAVCQIVFNKISRQKKIPIILLHNGRQSSKYKSTLGLFAEYKRINTTLNEKYRFVDFINSIEEQFVKTAPYQKCSHFIKDSGLKGVRFSIGEYLTFRYNKLVHQKNFNKRKLNPTITDYYLKHLSRLKSILNTISIKDKLNTLFKLQLPLLTAGRLRVIISITPSVFTKESENRSFADLDYIYPNRFSFIDCPSDNKTLSLYFSKDEQGKYLLTINGPLTPYCKDTMGNEFIKIMTKFLENEDYTIADLINVN